MPSLQRESLLLLFRNRPELAPELLRARLKCPACVLVVTPTEAVARWCRKPIEVGPGNAFAPLATWPQGGHGYVRRPSVPNAWLSTRTGHLLSA